MSHPDSARSSSRAPRWRRRGAIMLSAVLAATLLPSGASAQSETPAEQAAREIQEARDQANAAADAYFQAESVLDGLEDDLAGLQLQETQLQATVDELRGEVELVALVALCRERHRGHPVAHRRV